MKKKTIIIGSRGSPLALAQSEIVLKKLKKKHHNFKFLIKIIRTSGDKIRPVLRPILKRSRMVYPRGVKRYRTAYPFWIKDKPLGAIGVKGLFTKELERALFRKEIDLAVHSLKDLPVELPEGLALGAVSKREKVNDIFISRRGIKLNKSLPPKAKIGTSSLRRRAQLLNFRADLNIVDLRGNLQTRINKIKSENLDGIVVAYAGFKRLKIKNVDFEIIPKSIILPCVGQGALAIETREDDHFMKNVVKCLNHFKSFAEVEAERTLLRVLGGGCLVPLGALAEIKNNEMVLQARILSPDGKNKIEYCLSGVKNNPYLLGERLGNKLLSAGAKEFL